jgi:endo-alpha-1,4-polygalactosaminidase (GH114 family)
MINEIKSWGYQLQNIEPGKIARCGHDLVVIDHCNDDRPFSSAYVAAMRRRPDGGRRLVLAYMSIGEFYGEDEDGERNEAQSIRDSIGVLERFAAKGKPVFVVEYPCNDEQARSMRREIAEQGFIGLLARRDLDTL